MSRAHLQGACHINICSDRCSSAYFAGGFGPAAGRPQASAAIIRAGQHHQHPVHLRRRLLGSRADHLRARPFYLDRLCRAGAGLIAYGWQKKKAACVATSGPSLGRKRPRWAAIAGRTIACSIDTTIAIGDLIERRCRSGIQTEQRTHTKVEALALQSGPLPQDVGRHC